MFMNHPNMGQGSFDPSIGQVMLNYLKLTKGSTLHAGIHLAPVQHWLYSVTEKRQSNDRY